MSFWQHFWPMSTTSGAPVQVLPGAGSPEGEWFIPIGRAVPAPAHGGSGKYADSPSKYRDFSTKDADGVLGGAWGDINDIGSSLSETGTTIFGGLLSLLRSPADSPAPVGGPASPFGRLDMSPRQVLLDRVGARIGSTADARGSGYSPSPSKRKWDGEKVRPLKSPVRHPHGFGSTGQGGGGKNGKSVHSLLVSKISPTVSAVSSPSMWGGDIWATPPPTLANIDTCNGGRRGTVTSDDSPAAHAASDTDEWKVTWESSPEQAKARVRRSYKPMTLTGRRKTGALGGINIIQPGPAHLCRNMVCAVCTWYGLKAVGVARNIRRDKAWEEADADELCFVDQAFARG